MVVVVGAAVVVVGTSVVVVVGTAVVVVGAVVAVVVGRLSAGTRDADPVVGGGDVESGSPAGVVAATGGGDTVPVSAAGFVGSVVTVDRSSGAVFGMSRGAE